MFLSKLNSRSLTPGITGILSAIVLSSMLSGSVLPVFAQMTKTENLENDRTEVEPLFVDTGRTSLDQQKSANQLLNMGAEQQRQGNLQAALISWQEALIIFRKISDRYGEGIALGNIGVVYENGGDYKNAVAYYEKSLAISRKIRYQRGEASALGNLGNTYYELGEYKKSIEFQRQSLLIKIEIGDRVGVTQSLGSLGNVYRSQGEYEKAIAHDKRSLAISQEIGYRLGQAESHGSLGNTYSYLGEYEKAIAFKQQSLKISREIGYRFGEAISLGSIASPYYHLGNDEKSKDHLQQYLTISREIGYRLGEAQSLVGLGSIYNRLGEYEKAIEFYNQSLALSREVENRSVEALSLGNLSNTYSNLGESQQALNFSQQSLVIAREIGDRSGEGHALSNLGYQLVELDKPDLAINFFKQSVNVREGIRVNIQGLSSTLQKSYTQTVAGTYRSLADLLISRGRIAEAQQVLELLKVQELNDFSEGTRAPDKLTKIDLNATEKQIKDKHGTLIAFGSKFYDCEQNNCSQYETLKQEFKDLDEAFYELAAEITRKVESNRKQQVSENTYDFQASADRVVTAHQDSIIIYPLVLPDKVRLLWAAKGGVLADEVCPLTEDKLTQTVTQFQDLLRNSMSDIEEVKRVGKDLYDCLVQPLEPELKANKNGIKHLIFAPDRITNYIPMGALYDGEKFLIQRYRISNVLSAGLTQTDGGLPQTTQEVSVLGLGLSEGKPGFNPLHHVPLEIDTVVRSDDQDSIGIYPGLAFLNQSFDLSALENNLRGRQIVHIATHGEFIPSDPRQSYLLLGTGKKYPIPKIQTLRQLQDVHLVVLSACETAKSGPDQDGIEVAGMSSYFLRDKAKAVLASLWKVNDESTSELMQAFYQNLATGKMSKAEALQKAQLSLLTGDRDKSSSQEDRATMVPTIQKTGETGKSSKSLEHPYYWAPFILIGNGL